MVLRNRPSKDRHGKTGESIIAPYYSALAQGRVLMFFARLAEVTGDVVAADAADQHVRELPAHRAALRPVCGERQLARLFWLQEWPCPGSAITDDTFNGHNSAAFGIYEYWHLTRDARALESFRAAATTAAALRRRLPQSGVARFTAVPTAT